MHDDPVSESICPARVGLAVKGAKPDEVGRGDVISVEDAVEIKTEIELDFEKSPFYKSEITENQGCLVNIGLQTKAAKFSSSKSFKGQRQRKEHEKTNSCNAGRPPRPPNQLMLATGVDTTTYMANEVQLSAATKKKYEKGIDAELLARNFPQEQLSSFRNYLSKKKKLKELVALEKNVEDVTTIKSFAIKSAFDWSSILRKQAGD